MYRQRIQVFGAWTHPDLPPARCKKNTHPIELLTLVGCLEISHWMGGNARKNRSTKKEDLPTVLFFVAVFEMRPSFKTLKTPRGFWEKKLTTTKNHSSETTHPQISLSIHLKMKMKDSSSHNLWELVCTFHTKAYHDSTKKIWKKSKLSNTSKITTIIIIIIILPPNHLEVSRQIYRFTGRCHSFPHHRVHPISTQQVVIGQPGRRCRAATAGGQVHLSSCCDGGGIPGVSVLP